MTITAEPPGVNCAVGGEKLQVGGGAPEYVCSGSDLTWTTITTATQAQGHFGYVSDASTAITLTLPASSALSVGDEIRLLVNGSGDVSVTPNAGQTFKVNGGLSWTPTSAPSLWWMGMAASSDGTQVVAVNNNNGGIYRSTDSGTTWTQTSAPGSSWGKITSSSDGTKLVATRTTAASTTRRTRAPRGPGATHRARTGTHSPHRAMAPR